MLVLIQQLDRIPDLVDRAFGSFSLSSKYIADLVHHAVKEAKEPTRRAAEAGAKVIKAIERGADESTSAFIAWAKKYDIDVQDRLGGPTRLDFGKVDDIRKKLREGIDLWTSADMPEERYRLAIVLSHEEISSDPNCLNDTKMKSHVMVA